MENTTDLEDHNITCSYHSVGTSVGTRYPLRKSENDTSYHNRYQKYLQQIVQLSQNQKTLKTVLTHNLKQFTKKSQLTILVYQKEEILK